MSTFKCIWQCSKCGKVVTAVENKTNCWNSFNKDAFRRYVESRFGPLDCPEGGDHDYNQLYGEWIDD